MLEIPKEDIVSKHERKIREFYELGFRRAPVCVSAFVLLRIALWTDRYVFVFAMGFCFAFRRRN
jgi:hypothetical protein